MSISDEHSTRVGTLMRQMCLLIGVDYDPDVVQRCGELHDIGKVHIPREILNSPRRLTEKEFLVVQSHVILGRDMLLAQGHCPSSPEVIVAYLHHEKWDGTGYPCGLAGEEIPHIVRIATLCDVFDALMEKRSYKKPLSIESAGAIISEARGKHFDPVLTDVFLSNIRLLNHVRLHNLNVDITVEVKLSPIHRSPTIG